MHVMISGISRFTDPTGICKHTANIVSALKRQDRVQRISLLLGDWQESYFKHVLGIESGGKLSVKTVAIRNGSLSRNAWFIGSLPALEHELKPDLLHLTFPIPVLKRKFTCPVVVSIHDLYPYDFPQNFGFPNYLVNRMLLRLCVANSDGFICVSNTTQERSVELLKQAFSKKPTAMIYNAVEFTNVDPARPAFIHDGDRFIFAVGQHRKNKNHDLLLRAFSSRQNALDPTLKLVIVGGHGPETDTLRNIVASNHLKDRVILASALSEQELCWLYIHCELFVAASSVEGFCLPLVEARGLAPKIVCSDIPIFRELAGVNSRFFSLSGQAEANLTDAICAALSGRANAMREALAEFSLAQIGNRFVEFYLSFLEMSSSR